MTPIQRNRPGDLKPSHVALLRGINVGGKNLIGMPDLAACFRDGGYRDVRTYIQSGNVLFTAGRVATPKLEDAIEKMLEERFKLPNPRRGPVTRRTRRHDRRGAREPRVRGAAQRRVLPEASAHG